MLAGVEDGTRAFCGPEQLHIDLTNICNMRCLCCWHRSPLIPRDEVPPHWDPRHSLPYEKVLGILDDAALLGVKRIIYSGGGDPLFHPRLFDVLRATEERGIEMMLVSNLTMADEETMRRIAGSGVDRLLVSVWAGDEETYMRMHPGAGPGVFHRVVSLLHGLDGLRAEGGRPQLVIMNVVCKENVYNVESMIRLAMDAGAAEVWFQPVDVENERLRQLLLDRGEIDHLIETLTRCSTQYRAGLKAGQENLLGFDEFIEKLGNSRAAEGIFHSDVIDTIPCYMGWAESRVLANGDVVPCCKADKMPLGNIHRRGFRGIWLSRSYGKFREKAKSLPKSDPYFRKISCYKVCDDWWLNKQVHLRYREYCDRRRREEQL